MKKRLYAMYDSVGEFYSNPLVYKTDADAQRSFIQAGLEVDQIKATPEDFSMHFVGFFDDNAGELLPTESKVIMSGTELKTRLKSIEKLQDNAESDLKRFKKGN